MNRNANGNHIEKLRKWKWIRNITLIIFMFFILVVFMLGIGFAMDHGVYPDSHFGLTRFESFKMTLGFISIISAIPLMVDIILFLISMIQIQRIKRYI